MGFCNFVVKAVATTGTVAAGIVALPILGPVGAISTAGAVVAASIGTAAAAADEINDSK